LGSSTQKIFIVSLDGATFDVLRPLIRQGLMPNLGRMMEEGLSAELESVIPPVTGPAWTSFMTGKNPSKHGIFEFSRFDEKDYEWKLNNSQFIRSKTLWQILTEQGKRSVVLNLPYTYPPYEINGLIVCGWDAPSVQTNFTYPTELGKEILQRIPDYSSTHDVWLWKYISIRSDAQFDRFIDKQILGFQHEVELASHFLDTEEWDVFMTHFQQTDWLQHKVWSYIAKACSNSANKDRRLEKVRSCYREFDRLVGVLLDKVKKHNPVKIILSDHGFGQDRGNICVNYFFNQWGYFFLSQQNQAPMSDIFRKSKHKVLRMAFSALAKAKHRILDARRYKTWAAYVHGNVEQKRLAIDWVRTKVALVTGSETGFVYVNVKGRGPLGNVEPGTEYENLVSEVMAKLRDLRHPRTGENLFAKVARGRDIYPEAGEDILLPDIVLIGAHGFGFSLRVSDAMPETIPEGCHRPLGVLLMQGDGLKSRIPNFHPRLIDMAPTILHLLGMTVPRDMDGRVLEEIWPEPQTVRYDDTDNSVIQEKATYTAEESDLIEQRLKGLGYLE
jgi:predicted AlkP superfamily phosphohydrolase/phosphomutase